MKNLEILHQVYRYHDFIKNAIESASTDRSESTSTERNQTNAVKDENGLSDIQWTIVNPGHGNLYDLEVAIVINDRLYQVSLAKQDNVKYSLLPKYSESLKIVGMDYSVTYKQLYLAYESGQILSVILKKGFAPEERDVINFCKYDLVMKFDTKLHCMKLSPDQEIGVVVTDEGNVITMLNFETKLSEVNLHSSDFGEKQFITVGWGKKETQFRGGSRGKMTKREPRPDRDGNVSDDGRARITWRGDGALFAVSFVHATTNLRQFKVFNFEGILQYTSEPNDELEECLAWKPSGDFIATTCAETSRSWGYPDHVITCYEKNGLKHNYDDSPSVNIKPIGEADYWCIEKIDSKVTDIFWSPDSEILTIIYKHVETGQIDLQLWTENNCTWYLKQVMVFYKVNPLIRATWNVRTCNRGYKKELILLTLNGLTYCRFVWRVNHNSCKTTNDNAVIGVIRERKMLLTDFKHVIAPPPMGQTCLMFIRYPINAVVFAPNYSAQVDSNDKRTSWMCSSAYCTVSCFNLLGFFKRKAPTSQFEYEASSKHGITCDIPDIRNCIFFGRLHHFLWITENSMLCVATEDSCSYLCEIILHKIDTKDGCVMIRHAHKLDFDVTHLVPTHDENVIYLLGVNCARIIRRNDSSSTSLDNVDYSKPSYSIERINESDEFELNECENEAKYCQVEQIKIDSRHVLIALCENNVFYIDHKVAAKHITSFYVHSAFLLLTTEELLICVPLSENGLKQLTAHDLNVPPNYYEKKGRAVCETKFSEDIYMRQIDRNSHLVGAIPHTSKVILQAPRGNLECIRPRPMSLHIIGCHLDECNYRKAFEIMRLERINLNFIYDYNPQLFVDNARKFVNDIADKPNWLTQFLADLQNENVIKTMYAKCISNCSARSVITEDNEVESNKVERVCELLRNIMEEQDANRLIEPILISLVKHQYKEGLERALEKVKSIKLTEDSQNLPISADDALRCLLHLVNIDVLYNIALGTYDFELTMFVASKSSKDPKEYVPFLNSLKNLSDKNYMKYSIDMHLKRYESALEHISKVPSKFDECSNLIRDQKLYESAIKMFEKSSEEHKKVAALYAEYLSTERKHHQAGTMFYRSGDLRKALEAFGKSAASWQEAIMVSTELKLSPTDLHEFYEELVKQLYAERMHSDAATVLKDYLNDTEEAVAILCEGRIWKRAIRIALDIERLDLIETHIKPGLKEHAEDVLSNLSKKKELFLKLKTRLISVRKEMREKQRTPVYKDHPLANDFLSEQIYDDRSREEVLDVLSDASSDTTFSRSSQISSTSGRSSRSRKKARKHARKILRIKEGGMFEDVGLVFELHKIISDIYRDRDETTQLGYLLTRFEFDVESENVRNKTKEFFQVIKSSVPEIWDNSSTNLDKLTNFMDKLLLQENIADFNPRELSSCIKYPPEIDWKYYDLN